MEPTGMVFYVARNAGRNLFVPNSVVAVAVVSLCMLRAELKLCG